ncbi:hypothetical protein [Rhizobium leguminosarum]|nr:hypothetical protein [Rhizobium leguminosarum]
MARKCIEERHKVLLGAPSRIASARAAIASSPRAAGNGCAASRPAS